MAHPVQIMGILNLTPDSFYDGGQHNTKQGALKKVAQFIEEGVDCIDLGAYSSRPGAVHISEEEEEKRLLPVLKEIVKNFPSLKISVDTFRSSIAKISVLEGAGIINDISGGTLDEHMFTTIAQLKVPYVLMHMKGTPQTMQHHLSQGNVILDIQNYFTKKLHELSNIGVNDVILDVGFGFGKTVEQNYQLLSHLSQFHHFKKPLLVGISRKSMLYKPLQITPEEALVPSMVAHTLALQQGIHYIRTHDVKATRQTIEIHHMYAKSL